MATMNSSLTITIPITADGTAGINAVISRPGTVIDIQAVASVTSGGGTVVVSKAGAAISAALVLATADAVVRAAALTQANAAFTVGQVLRVTTGQAADRGTVYVTFLPTPGFDLP